jgi:hypothetical protein
MEKQNVMNNQNLSFRERLEEVMGDFNSFLADQRAEVEATLPEKQQGETK